VTVRRSDIKGYIQERTRGRSEWPSERYLALRVASRVAAQLDELRARRGLSYAALASRAGTSKAQVIRLLSGTYDGMTTRSIAKLASALGSDVDVSVRPLGKPRATAKRTVQAQRMITRGRARYGGRRAAKGLRGRG